MTYTEWVKWLETRNPMPLVRPGLDATRGALQEAGLLELADPAKIIHIAGTNGKGTTAKALEQLLLAAGQSVGLYTSPHLVDTTERIRLEGANIDREHFARLCEHYRPLIEKWNLSHFESLTVFAADCFFKSRKTDWAIFEIGLGGTWDATNAIPHDTSVITSLGYDHMNILGNSLEEIADNKFGIISTCNTVYHRAYPEPILQQLADKCRAMKAKSVFIGPPECRVKKSFPLPEYWLHAAEACLKLPLPGLRAAENIHMALEIFKGLGFDALPVLPALAEMDWPARMTPLQTSATCPVFLSGDHNIQGLESLREILMQIDYKKIFLILGVSKNREHADFLKIISEIPRSEILLTKPSFQGVEPQSPRENYYPDPLQALSVAQKLCQSQDLILITGSLYLCGDFLKANL